MHPSVGSVIWLITLSNVLLPAPLRPMMPMTSAWLHSPKPDITKCPKVPVIHAPAIHRPRRLRLPGSEGIADALHQQLSQGAIHVGGLAHAVLLTDPVDAHDHVAHRLHHIGKAPLRTAKIVQAGDEQRKRHPDRKRKPQAVERTGPDEAHRQIPDDCRKGFRTRTNRHGPG